LDLFRELLLVVKFVWNVFVEKICTFCQHSVAKILSNLFSLRAFGSFVNEILEEINNFMRKWVKSVVLLVSKFLCNCFVVLLKKV
jgi:hypothetical protein